LPANSSDKALISSIYKELKKLNTKKNDSIDKGTNEQIIPKGRKTDQKMHVGMFNIHSHKVNAHKIILYFCLTILRMAIIKETTTNADKGHGRKTLLPCCWECKLLWLDESGWRLLIKTKNRTPICSCYSTPRHIFEGN
jgi:hypothetical protein